MPDKKNRVNVRDIDRPISEYPKGTEIVHTDNTFIPLPTKEEMDMFLKKKGDTTSR